MRKESEDLVGPPPYIRFNFISPANYPPLLDCALPQGLTQVLAGGEGEGGAGAPGE